MRRIISLAGFRIHHLVCFTVLDPNKLCCALRSGVRFEGLSVPKLRPFRSSVRSEGPSVPKLRLLPKLCLFLNAEGVR